MGIYSEWDKFCKMAEESAGTASTSLPTPASWKDNLLSYLDAVKIFAEVCFLLLLLLYNFHLWLDVIGIIYGI